MSEPFHFTAGRVPLLVSMPHVGLEIPPALEKRMTPAAALRADTDWHVDRLYDFLEGLGASVIRARYSRYVIDLNRDPENRALYPGANNTELCPTSTFDLEPLYRPGQEPGAEEIAERREAYWWSYHTCLQDELARLKDRHGVALLWDAHSIRSIVPRFFEGRLPDLNLGSGGGGTAAAALQQAVVAVAEGQQRYSHVLNGRFKGGFITRAYGRPEEGVHALQLELSQATYMDETPPFGFREDLAVEIRPLLRQMLVAALTWAGATRA